MNDYVDGLRTYIAWARGGERDVVGIVLDGSFPVMHFSHRGLPEREPAAFLDDIPVWCDDETARRVFAQS